MENFLDRYQVTKLNQDQIKHINNSIITKEIETFIKSLPTKTGPRPLGFNKEFYQTFIDLIPILSKLLHKIETEETLPKLFNEATVMLIPKPHKDPTIQKELQTNFPHEQRC